MPRLKSAPATSQEIHTLTGDGSDAAAGVDTLDSNEVDAHDSTESVPSTQRAADIQQFHELFADRLLSEGEWEDFLDVPAVTVKSAQRAEGLQKLAHTHRSWGGAGFKGRDVARWIEANKIPCRLTPAARVAISATIDEIIATIGINNIYRGDQIEGNYGLRADSIQRASRAGVLKGCGIWNDPGSISGAALRHWLGENASLLASAGIAAPAPSPLIVSRIQRARQLAGTSPPPVVETAAKGGDKLSSDALAELQRLNDNESAADAEYRADLHRQYAEILRRRGEPLEGDAERLASICLELKFTPARVTGDIAALDRESELESLLPLREGASRDLAAARAHRAALPKKHKEELRDAATRETSAFNAHSTAAAAPAQLQALRAGRPELFRWNNV